MKKLVFIILSSTYLFADTIGGEIVLGGYSHSLEGTSKYHSSDSIDFVDTLGFSSAQDIFFKAYIEHPFPLVPNVKLSYQALSHSAKSLVSLFSWGEIQNFTGNIDNSVHLSYTDVTLYYELLDNWIELDGGLTFRSIEGDMSIKTRFISDSISYEEILPLLYGKGRFHIPSTDVSFQAEINFMPLGDTSTYDLEFSARYTFMLGLGIELGYKSFYIQSDTLVKDMDTKMEFTGPYASVSWDF